MSLNTLKELNFGNDHLLMLQSVLEVAPELAVVYPEGHGLHSKPSLLFLYVPTAHVTHVPCDSY